VKSFGETSFTDENIEPIRKKTGGVRSTEPNITKDRSEDEKLGKTAARGLVQQILSWFVSIGNIRLSYDRQQSA